MSIATWRRRTWRAGADRWIDRSLGTRRRTGRSEQIHVVPWSTVFRVPTDRGDVFFKATWPRQRHEAGVTEALARWAPRDVGVVVASDPRRGWLLVEDAGVRLREVFAKDRDLRHWRQVLPQYAELQLKVASHAAQLLRLGAPDRRAAALPERYERLLRNRELLRVGLKEGLTKARERKLRELVPRVREWCDELAGAIPDTIQHDDFHDGQVFVKDGRYRILDWGDANVSHPFYSMTVALRSIKYTFKLKDDAPELARVRDLYLEPFTTVATRKQIQSAYGVARKLGRICRALTWASLVPHLPPARRREERGDVPGWLELFLEVSGG